VLHEDTMRVCSAASVGGSRGSGGLSCSYIRKYRPFGSLYKYGIVFSCRAVLGTRLGAREFHVQAVHPFPGKRARHRIGWGTIFVV
jgi:hypothetical protein